MSYDERMDRRLGRFLEWQAGQLDGTPDAHGMTLRIGRRIGARTADRPRLVWAIVALALVAALAAAATIGSRLTEHQPTGGLLAYEINGDIFLADHDGSHPRKVTAGTPWVADKGGGPSYVLGDGGPAWAPDGRHLLFFDIEGVAAQLTGHIADASGHVVASIPNIWVDATWSPDSTRIVAWTGGSWGIGATQISIFGIDGALQETLPLPTGYGRHRESAAQWARDGRSVYVRIDRGGGSNLPVWQLPIDGSAPRKLDGSAPMNLDHSFAHDGSRLAYVSDSTLFVSNADGSDPRVLVVGRAPIWAVDGSVESSGEPGAPIWSPDDQRIAYDWNRATQESRLVSEPRIVDVASGTVHTVVADSYVTGTLGWSPVGDELLYVTSDQAGHAALWSVNVDGTGRTLIAAGADRGYWQPVQSGR